MAEPMRVLQVLGGLDIGGAETLVMNLYRHLDRQQIQFDFVKHNAQMNFFEPEIKRLGGNIYTCPRYKVYNHIAYVRWWKQFFRKHPQYKVIHGHVRSTAAIYLQIAKSFGLYTIVHSHSTRNPAGISRYVKAALQWPIRRVADYFVACSQTAGEWLFGKSITQQSNFFVLPNAIDIERFVYNPAVREKMRKQLQAENQFVVGNVGRLVAQKNQSFLLQVFAQIQKQYPQARLLLVGDGPLKQTLKKQAQALCVEKFVTFADGTDPAFPYYQAMDVFVFPSLYEGLGMALVEAQSAGLPCVVSDSLPWEADLQVGLITRVSLKESAAHWAQQVLARRAKKRTDTRAAAQAKGYDIKAAVKWLKNVYENAGEKHV